MTDFGLMKEGGAFSLRLRVASCGKAEAGDVLVLCGAQDG